MRKISFLLILAIFYSSIVNAQEKRNIFSFGASYGLDKNINAYRLEANNYGNTFYNDDIYNNISLDFGIYTTKKFRPRIEFKYVRMGYRADWVNTGVTSIKETVVDLYNFSLNLHMDYILFSIKKFDISISPAVKWEFNKGKEFYNERYDGTYGYDNYNKITAEYPHDVLGGAVSVIIKYNITNNIGATVTPEYTYFFNEFVKTNDKYYQRLSANIGLDFAF